MHKKEFLSCRWGEKMNALDQLFDEMYEHAIGEAFQAAGPIERKLALRNNLARLLGDFTYLEENIVHEEPRVLEVEEFDTYTREYVMLPITNILEIPMYILTPKTGRKIHPTVLAIHGHGTGVNEALGLTTDGTPEPEPTIHNQFALKLVKRGLKVFLPEVIGFGTRRLTRDIEAGNINSCEAMSKNLLMEGKTLAGLRVWEARKVLDFIEKQTDVAKDNLGMMGFSGGSVISTFTAVLDQRPQAVVLSCYPNTFKGSIMSIRHCIDNYVPGILQYAELPEWISLIAPRKLFIEAGEQDHIFPVEHTREAIQEVQASYQNRPENFAYDIFPGKHQISGRKSFDWLKNQLV